MLQHRIRLITCLCLLCLPVIGAGDGDTPTVAVAIERGLTWLAAQQRENGTWSDQDSPALTALPMWAFARSSHPDRDTVIARARTALLSYVRDDGGIYRNSLLTGGLSTYNTAICMTALHALGDKSLTQVILDARAFVAASQHLGSDRYQGGFGYSKRTFIMHGDMQNTTAALQAMRLTADVEDLRPATEKRVDIDWDEALAFVSRLQNAPDAGTEQGGGFSYKPGRSPAGTATSDKGTVILRATGSMTYSGLLSLIYAQVDRDDHRVRSAMTWARNNWSLKENPGLGNSGLFFFYSVMGRALDTYGQTELALADGGRVNWRQDLSTALIAQQKPVDEKPELGYWVNDGSSRFWEGDAILVTSYAIHALLCASAE